MRQASDNDDFHHRPAKIQRTQAPGATTNELIESNLFGAAPNNHTNAPADNAFHAVDQIRAESDAIRAHDDLNSMSGHVTTGPSCFPSPGQIYFAVLPGQHRPSVVTIMSYDIKMGFPRGLNGFDQNIRIDEASVIVFD